MRIEVGGRKFPDRRIGEIRGRHRNEYNRETFTKGGKKIHEVKKGGIGRVQ